jgi:secretion/DNA translocation related TadE-like protein
MTTEPAQTSRPRGGRMRWLPRVLRDDNGSASVLAVAIIAALLLMTALLMTLATAFSARHQLQGATEAAALAAADVAAGFVGGYPCPAAAQVAAGNGVDLIDCEVSGPVVSLHAHRSVLGIDVTVAARAGPGPQ